MVKICLLTELLILSIRRTNFTCGRHFPTLNHKQSSSEGFKPSGDSQKEMGYG
ncbi:hypothetical protein D515_00273 [Grimontia indica]|uniref:Uncharacterized protein n=1 Tax=Grimontia indica TaxID=1056512 RepID=R1GWU2_9GAMM|nr:hypothetical protein D515_00273 [Grimontia indica]